MSIAATAASTGAPSNAPLTSASATGSSALGESQFLQLLTAQLKNQDPANPQSNSELAAQLAQFSSVEQLTSVNSNLSSLLVGQAGANQTADASLVGKEVLYKTNSVDLTSGQPAKLDADLSAPAAQVTAVITDSSGKVVRTEQFGAQPAGQVALTWDGLDNSGRSLPSGKYTVTVTAADSTGNPVTVTQEQSSLVSGISFANSYPQLIVSTGNIDLSNVAEINQAPAA